MKCGKVIAEPKELIKRENMFQKIRSRIKTEGMPWIKQHWLLLIVSVIFVFSLPLIRAIILLYGIVATIGVEMLKAMIQAEATVLGFYGLIVVYALTSLDNRIDTLEEQIFKVEERYLNQPDVIESATTNIGKTKIAERSKRLDKMKKIRGKTVFSALYSGILLIGSLLASILGLGFLGIPNQEWAFNLCSLSAMLFFFGIGMTLVMIYDLTQF